jgi:hypothetical protein
METLDEKTENLERLVKASEEASSFTLPSAKLKAGEYGDGVTTKLRIN